MVESRESPARISKVTRVVFGVAAMFAALVFINHLWVGYRKDSIMLGPALTMLGLFIQMATLAYDPPVGKLRRASLIVSCGLVFTGVAWHFLGST